MNLASNVLIENSDGTYFLNKPTTIEQRDLFFSFFHVIDKEKAYFLKDDFSNLETDSYGALVELKKDTNINDIVYIIKNLCTTVVTRAWSIPSLGDIIEINSIFANKGVALEFLSSYYGIPLSRCFSFGDGDNDIEMLQKAGSGHALRNGSKTAKLAAKYMTKYSNDEDGVIKQLKHVFGEL